MKIVINIILCSLIAFHCRAQQKNVTKLGNPDSLYNIKENVQILTPYGVSISAMVVTKKGVTTPLPTILYFTIYVKPDIDLYVLKIAADSGYVGVMAYSRGKRYSNSEIFPYENDGKDANEVIDWISKQKWSNGKVGMDGGSYNGFTQWAAAKYKHSALKTIIPAAANRPGMGLPMENNIFINPNYAWVFHVTNNKMKNDDDVNNDRERFDKMETKWWESGKSYRKIDSIDGTSNKYLQRWLLHPSYDKYWQNMVPYKQEFENINIPVLTLDGYYNDSQLSSLYYFREHTKYNKNVENYLVIGPYDHLGSQYGGDSILYGYKVDSIALFRTRKLRYQWFNYTLRDGAKPEMLKDKINYELMGTNRWESASSLEKIKNADLRFYLENKKKDKHYKLTSIKPTKITSQSQTVNFADRTTYNDGFYPSPIIRKELDIPNGFSYISEPFKEKTAVNGSFSGELKVSCNKKDFDFSVALYEVMSNGDYFQLSYFIGRASYSKNIESRNLLNPNKIETILFSNSRLVCKQLSINSRLLIVVNVIKTSTYQINYGTGKDVSDETIEDAKDPLKINWYNNSFVNIPVWKN